MRRVAIGLVLWAITFGCQPAARAQDECRSHMCPNGAQAEAVDGQCMCGNDVFTDVGQTCSANWACPNSNEEVGEGAWPNCLCRKINDLPWPKGVERPPHFGGETPFHPGLGGVDVCSQFLQCPPRAKMAVDDDTCICRR